MKERLITYALIGLLSITSIMLWDGVDKESKRADDNHALFLAEQEKKSQIQTKVVYVTAKAGDARIKVKEALDEAPAYRDTPTPKPVVDSLCKQIRCK
ncbi:hypothetical protein [Pseudomonas phage Njord]|uniref:Uncharacterized protein n=1 Tax=Pseudomonas phage Njord TaxID=2163985 RepID=A0A2S1GML1_9CAUD|nr:hypothetical protein HOT08_gp44 [Pseudomonas phage Njord]AWD90632.1 hypothetical protein [Pseudomonas phage Njord]